MVIRQNYWSAEEFEVIRTGQPGHIHSETDQEIYCTISMPYSESVIIDKQISYQVEDG